MFLKILLIGNLLGLTLSGCTTPEPIGAQAAQAALMHAWQADQHVVWELEWPAAPVGGLLTVESWRAGQRYRFEILESSAPNLVGQILIFDGQTGWRYNRFDLERPPSSSSPSLPPVSDAFAIIARLTESAPELASQETVQHARGSTQKITVLFNPADSLTVWRDEATGLPVRVIFVVAGQQATLRARSFEPLPNPPEGLFKPNGYNN